MKITRKFTSLAVAAVASAALALTGCGGSSAPKAKTNSDPNTLTVWAWDPAFNIYAMKEAEKIYQKDHPDFKLNIVESSWDDLQTKLTTLAQSNQTKDLPDIFLMQNNAFQKNVTNFPDIFSNFTDSGVDFTQFPESVTSYSKVDGVNYGLPFDSGTAITALRTDILQEAGYTVQDFTDITWADYLKKGKDVLAKTGKPLLSGRAGQADVLMMILQGAGGSLFDAKGNPTITDNDKLLKSVEIYRELVKSGVMIEVNSWDEYIGSMVNSQVAGTMQGIWIVASIQTAKDQSGKWEITNLPKIDGLSDATNYSANGGSSWAISSTANQKLAADFLAKTFAGSTELYDKILPSAGVVTYWQPAAKSPAYEKPQEFFGNKPIYQMVAQYATKVPTSNVGVYYYEALQAVSTSLTKVVSGTDPKAALMDAQKAVEFAMK